MVLTKVVVAQRYCSTSDRPPERGSFPCRQCRPLILRYHVDVIFQGDITTLAGVYTFAFLGVMTLFSVGTILLKFKRPSLPREVTVGYGTTLVGLSIVSPYDLLVGARLFLVFPVVGPCLCLGSCFHSCRCGVAVLFVSRLLASLSLFSPEIVLVCYVFSAWRRLFHPSLSLFGSFSCALFGECFLC